METRIEVEATVVRLKLMLDHGSIASSSQGRLYSSLLDPLSFVVTELAPLDGL